MPTRDLGAWPGRTVGDVVAEDYGRAAVFKRFGIDFCCGGGRTVEAACEEAGVDYETVAAALNDAAGHGGGRPADLRALRPQELVRHIVDTHHAYVRETLPILNQFSQKVARVHGPRHPELGHIELLLTELSAEMRQHMDAEERVLFPRIERLVAGSAAGFVADANGPSATGAATDAADTADASALEVTLGETIDALEGDHDRAGAILGRLRALSRGFSPPADACATYRALYAKLAEFEADLHRHVHLENNVLFPSVRALEEGAGQGAEA